MTGVAPGQGLVHLDRVTLRDVDFRKVSFDTFVPLGCTFEACDFRDTVFDRRLAPLFAAHPRSLFRACHFDGSDLRRAPPGQSRFEACTFDGARLDEWTVTAAEFVDCRFAGLLTGVVFHGKPSFKAARAAEELDPPRTANEFRGNDFRGADLVECAFIRGIDLGLQRWPEDDRYVRLDHFQQRLVRGRTEILGWSDLAARGQALDLLQAASFLYREQGEVIARRVEERSPISHEVQRRMWETLASVL